MQCEICGSEIRGKPSLVKVERSELNVCSKCSRFGTPVDKPVHVFSSGSRYGAPASRLRPRRRDIFDQMVNEVVTNYGEIVRKERERRGWSQEDLALKILEKANLIRKIEREELMLEEDVRKKLERVLEIKLAETLEDADLDRRGSRKDLTLGDIATIKKKKQL